MYYLKANGTNTEGETLEGMSFEEGPSVTVEFPEAGVFYCTECGETREDDSEPRNARCNASECQTCSGYGEVDGAECSTCEGDSLGAHAWQAERHSWLNHAGIAVDESDNSVTFSLSISDPRGAFTFNVWQADDGRILLSVPTPGEPGLHAPLKDLGFGKFQIG